MYKQRTTRPVQKFQYVKSHILRENTQSFSEAVEGGWGQGVIAAPTPIFPDFEVKKSEQKQIEIPGPHQIFGPSATTDF